MTSIGILLASMAIPVAIVVASLLLIKWLQRRDGRRSPLSGKVFPQPGEQLRQRIADVTDDIGEKIAFRRDGNQSQDAQRVPGHPTRPANQQFTAQPNRACADAALSGRWIVAREREQSAGRAEKGHAADRATGCGQASLHMPGLGRYL